MILWRAAVEKLKKNALFLIHERLVQNYLKNILQNYICSNLNDD